MIMAAIAPDASIYSLVISHQCHIFHLLFKRTRGKSSSLREDDFVFHGERNGEHASKGWLSAKFPIMELLP